MRNRGTEKSSILLLGRNTLIIGAVVVTIISFGLGYFFGYKGGDITEAVKQVKDKDKDKDNAKPAETQPAEEKKVLEVSSAKNAATSGSQPAAPANAAQSQQSAPVTPPADAIKPPEPIPEIGPPKLPEPASKRAGKGSARGRKAREDEEDNKAVEKEKIKTEKALEDKAADSPAPKKPAGVKTKSRKSPAANVKKGTQKADTGKKQYTVQMGAFPTKEGAEQLQRNLKAKGLKPYIEEKGDNYYRVRTGSYGNKKDAEREAIAISKQTGLQNFVTAK